MRVWDKQHGDKHKRMLGCDSKAAGNTADPYFSRDKNTSLVTTFSKTFSTPVYKR
jgi:hypothetical protein